MTFIEPPVKSVVFNVFDLHRLHRSVTLSILTGGMMDLLGIENNGVSFIDRKQDPCNINFETYRFLDTGGGIITFSFPTTTKTIEDWLLVISHIKVHKDCKINYTNTLDMQYSGLMGEHLTICFKKVIDVFQY